MIKIVLTLLLCSILETGTCISQSIKEDNMLIGTFDGRTPCQELAKQMHQTTIPECIKIKWRLKLYKDSLKTNTGTFELEGFVFRTKDILKGKWNIIIGTNADPHAIVYQLSYQQGESLFIQKGDDNVLFFLDQQKNLMVGNRDFSYTLNRKTLK